jgi:hypothetical protein
MTKVKYISSFLLTSLLVVSCTSQQVADDKLSVQQKQKIEQCKSNTSSSKKIKREAVTTGCLASLVFWKAIGQDNPAALICAAGGAAGFLIGSSVAERKCEYAVKENQVDGEIRHAASMNQKFALFFIEQEANLLKQKKIVESLIAKVRKNGAERSSIKAVQSSLKTDLIKEKALLADLMKESSMKQETLILAKNNSTSNNKDVVKKLLDEIKALRRNISKMKRNSSELARLNTMTNQL